MDDYTVLETSRQLGCSVATVRLWITTGQLTALHNSKPLRVDRSSVLAARARALSRFDGVADLSNADGRSSMPEEYELESARLRQQLRAVVASVESFDNGLTALRTSQRILLESLLSDLQDVQPVDR